MCMMHKIIQEGSEELESETWFEPAGVGGHATRAAADPLNVRIAAGRLEVRRNFFSNRVTVPWNNVPADLKQLKKVGRVQKSI